MAVRKGLVLLWLCLLHWSSSVRPAANRKGLSESSESKVERLGQIFKQNVRQLRERSLTLDLVFLVDESSSVGASNFRSELRFVRKLLSDFPVSPENTRVALVTFSSKTHVVTRVDHISKPHAHQHKCSLFNQEIPAITYRGGGTYTKGAFQRASQILQNSNRNATKVIFLITDGYSNGGDPRPVAASLRMDGVEIFTLGIWQGNIRELHDMASLPKDQHCYFVHNFAEFEALARRALHEDLPTGGYIQEDLSRCSSLCDAGHDCCDLMASCKCGTHTGQYDCVCEKGHYGKGLQHECTACPSGTYKPEATPGGLGTCIPCPDNHHTSQPGSTALSDCVCQEGYMSVEKTCHVVHCLQLAPPENGFFIQGVCNHQYNAACGVRCRVGFDLHGSSIRLCQADGTWSGTEASCRVRSCPKLSPPPHGQVNCAESGPPYTGECEVRCAKGYQVLGHSRLTCQSNSQWSGPPPRCVEIRCQPVSVKHVLMSPPACGTREMRSGASCQLSCRQGYQLLGNAVVRCLPSGEWSDNLHKATCADAEPPWIQCPEDITTETNKHQGSASISWKTPTAHDNSGEEVTVQVTPILNLPQLFPIGVEMITYSAVDRTGNKANCSFSVTVMDMEPPLIDRCRSPPLVQAVDTETVVFWEEPQFSDNSGAPLNISSSHIPGSLFPDGETSVFYTATDPSGNNRTCELIITVQGLKCEQPYVPVNADFFCTELEAGVNCTLHCRSGYSFTKDAVQSYFCPHNGVWDPPHSPDRPDCSLNRIANNGFKPFEMLFKASRCDDSDMLKSFSGDFKVALKEMIPMFCSGSDVSCNLEVMSQGQCLEYDYYENGFAIGPGGWGNNWGSQNGPDYTYFDSGYATDRQGPPMQQDARFHRSHRLRAKRHRKITGPTRDQKIQIYFNITANIPLPLTRNDSMEVANQKRLLRTLELLTNRLKRTLSKQPLSTFHVSSEMIVADPKSLESKKATLFCRPGSMLKGRMCVQCPLGTYYSLEHNECESCWIGSYQDLEGQLECKACPDGFSTAYLHSRSEAECKAQCKPGSSSRSGLETCESCPLGEYQPNFGSRHCLLCTAGTSTINRGAVDMDECGVPCSAGHFSRTGLVPCYPCPQDYYQPEEGRSYCLSCPFYGTTTVSGATAIQQCSSKPGQPTEQGILVLGLMQAFHECFLNPCQNKGTCIEVGVGYICTCQPGFTGAKCESDIDECDSTPCQNGGICQDGMGDFQCQCQPGYVGMALKTLLPLRYPLCEAEVNECSSSPCLNEGVCVDEVNKFTCSCTDGFTGSNCELEINECASSPCKNGGECRDMAGGFSCACVQGFTGVTCELNINDCDSNPCLNGGTTCLDKPGAFTCRCPPGFNGTRCETEMSSSFNLDFEVSGIHGFVMMDGLMPTLTAITCTFWMRSSDTINYGTPVSYAVDGGIDNAFLLIDYNGWVLYVNGKERITDCPAVNDGRWHHIGVSWRSEDGDWRVYIDGNPTDGGKNLSIGTTIPGGGALVLGQDQDQRGEGFNPVESFVGSLSQLNIWDHVLSSQQIRALASSCPDDLARGNVFAWPDFLEGVTGRVKVNPNCFFCADCPLLDHAVPYLRASSLAVSPGSQVHLSCDPGFYLVGEPLQKCLNRGKWSHSLPRCERVNCGVPPPLEHGIHRASDSYAGSSVVYQCRPGFYLLGEPKMLCTNSGKWAGNPPACLDVDECALGSDCDEHASCQNADGSHICTCIYPYSGDGRNCTEPVKCKNPGNPEFGHRDGSIFIMGSVVVFTCEEGYELIGSSHVTCSEAGTWDRELPYCRALSCRRPSVPQNAIIKGTNFTVTSKVSFSCNKGFLPKESVEIQCLSSLKWSRAPPVCKPVTCDDPPNVDKANFTLNGKEYLSTVIYTCKEGYRLQGPAELLCEALGEWASPPPLCARVNCRDPPVLKDAVTIGDNFTLGSQVHYICKEGYILLGVENRECLSSGEWSNSSAQCVPRSCGPPPNIDYALPQASHQLFGDTAIYFCTDGYTAGNNTKMLCNAKGLWAPPDGQDIPHCIANFCQRPPDLSHAILDSINKPKYASNTEVSYKCEEGFMLNSTGMLKCIMGGEWVPSPLSVACVPVRCSKPEGIERGHVSGTNYSFGAIVAYTCEKGFFIRGEKRRTCKANGEWGGVLPTCQPINCSYPPSLRQGYIRISYACNEGYRLIGKAERVCQANRQWSSDTPVCVLLTCDHPPDIKNGLYQGYNFQVGSKVVYVCKEGYELTGDAIWTCLKNGKWDKTETPRCSPVQCPEPPLEENHLVLRNLYSDSGTVELSCEEGYVLHGSSTLRCTPSQEWNDSFPVCKQVFCRPPPEIPFGDPLPASSYYGSVVTYSCMDGFHPGKISTVVCKADGQWSTPTPECSPVECPQPYEIPNGIVNVQGLTYLSSALYSCKPGYNIAGNATILCGQSGQWIGGEPVCHPVECPLPKEITNGMVAYSQLEFSRSVTYSCQQGYRLEGPKTLTCLETGKWDQEVPTCKQIYCSPPQPIDNGFVEGLDHKYGVTIFYSCFPGFQLVGENNLICQENGWSSAIPVCVPTDCGLPPHIDFGDYQKVLDPSAELSEVVIPNHSSTTSLNHSSVADTSYLHGTAVTYRCHPGYEITQIVVLVCQDDGTWNGTSPHCVPGGCKIPPTPDHGTVTITDTVLGSLVEYGCQEGYELEGQSLRQCVSGNRWSDAPPICKLVSCGHPGDIAGGIVLGTSFVFQAVIHYECLPGFILLGSGTRTCQADGKWNGKDPQCKAVSCGQPVFPSDVLVTGQEYTFSKKIVFNCMSGFTLKGDSVSICLSNSTWSHANPSCHPAFCSDPPPITNGRIIGADYSYKGEVVYECNKGYTLSGGSRRICNEDALWNEPPPQCDIVTCDPPEDISHGYLNGSSFMFQDVVEYICFPGYEVVGSPVLRCAEDGAWVGTVPECRPCVCSPPVLKFGAVLGREHNCGDQVWFRCDEGYRTLGPTKSVCEQGGVWSPGVPICSRGRCSSTPPTVPNAVFQGGSAIPPETITYGCRPGYRLRGSPHINCGRGGKWADPRLSCEPVSCGAPPYITNTQTVGETYTFGSQVQYRCLEGFELVTQTDKVICQSDATWSKHSIQCQPTPCLLPANITQVVVTGENITLVGGTVTLSCKTGFTLQGPAFSKCEFGGIWSPTFSSKSCVPVTCGKPLSLLHGMVEATGHSYGDRAVYSCLSGYEMKGDSLLTCQKDRTWSGNPPECSCENLPEFPKGSIVEKNASDGRALSFHCNKGYSLLGAPLVKCMPNGSWNAPFPVCTPKSCPPPPRGTDRSNMSQGGFTVGQQVPISCPKGQQAKGSAILTCRSDQTWTPISELCERVSCGPPLHVANGVVRGAVFQFGDVAVYSCFSGYAMEGYGRSTCLENGTWTPPPTCRAICWLQCQNGGMCQRPNTCSCPEGWMGRLCEEPICILPCLNGGRCVAPYQCECPNGWTGTRCQNAVCSAPCLNGGRCIRPNRCHCSQGWSGYDCSRKRKTGYFHF
uniref:Sushi, von Willebrand factor type A, EGF and pentraxin domain-containing protein 1 n=1 Tax=Denticeps clupeoides TaxID=299321 RepID=A0AAY4CTR2_9TELE